MSTKISAQVKVLEGKYPTRTIFSADCKNPQKECDEPGLYYEQVEDLNTILFAVEPEYGAMEIVGFVLDLDHSSITWQAGVRFEDLSKTQEEGKVESKNEPETKTEPLVFYGPENNPEKKLEFKLMSNVDFVPFDVRNCGRVCIPEELFKEYPTITLAQWEQLRFLWVKNVQIHDDIGEETMCFSADICWAFLKYGNNRYWFSEKVVAHAKNFGHGGMTNIDWINRTARKEVENMIKNLVKVLGDFEPLESYINTIVPIAYERYENNSYERARKMNSDRSKKWSKEMYVDALPMVHTDIRNYLDDSFRICCHYGDEIKEAAINEIWSEDFRTLKTDLLISQNDPLSKPEDRRKILMNTMIRHALAFSDDFLFNKEEVVKCQLSPFTDLLQDQGYDLSFLTEEESKDWFKALANEAYEKAVELRKKIVYPNAR